MMEEDKIGKKPMYRSRTWNQENRILAKENKRKIGIKVLINLKKCIKVYFLSPPTPGIGLLKKLRNREQELNKNKQERIKIVEKAGIKIEKLLTNKNPFKN